MSGCHLTNGTPHSHYVNLRPKHEIAKHMSPISRSQINTCGASWCVTMDHRLYMKGFGTHNKTVLFVIHGTNRWSDNAGLVPTFVLTLATKVAVYASMEQAPTELTYLIQSTNAHV